VTRGANVPTCGGDSEGCCCSDDERSSQSEQKKTGQLASFLLSACLAIIMAALRICCRKMNRKAITSRQHMRSLSIPVFVCLLGSLLAEAHVEVPQRLDIGIVAPSGLSAAAASQPQSHPLIGSAEQPSNVLASLRGGGSELFDPYHQQHYHQRETTDSGASRLQVSDVVLALRWTAEMNRQLESSAAANSASAAVEPADGSWLKVPPPRKLDSIRGGGGVVRTYEGSHGLATQGGAGSVYRIPSPQSLVATHAQGSSISHQGAVAKIPSSRLTIFHTANPRVSVSKPLSGLSRWGPDLALYLEHLLVNVLQVPNDEASTVLTLALLYVDRAVSVETPRSNGYHPTPYLTARTTHRLLLAALLLAAQASAATAHGGRGMDVAALYARASEAVGVSAEHVHEMVAWMKGALGDPGWLVAPDQLLEFQQLWTVNFGDRRREQQVQELPNDPDAPLETMGTPPAQSGAIEQVRVSTYADGTVPPQHEHRVYAQAVHTTY
jgi:hypothetical protein